MTAKMRENHASEAIRKKIFERNLLMPLDVLLVGATGVGKSSTLNAIFGKSVALVGEGVDPQTQFITSYQVDDYFRIHDSAGLGDGRMADEKHSREIKTQLLERCHVPYSSYGFIDLVLVILDGGSRDMGTTFQILESILLQCMPPDRVIVAINQADMAMKGRGWNLLLSQPESVLLDFLASKAVSVQHRLKETTGLHIRQPVFYSARFNWNVDRLIDHIASHVPSSRRNVELSI